MSDQQPSFLREIVRGLAVGAGRVIGGVIACALVGGLLGAGVGWWYAGTTLAVIGLVAGALAGAALWLAVCYLVASP